MYAFQGILYFILLCTYTRAVQRNCTFTSGQPPTEGSCKGPIEFTKAKRADIAFINKGCPIDKIPIVSRHSDNSTVVLCGECVPGSHGNYQFFVFNRAYNYNARNPLLDIIASEKYRNQMKSLVSQNSYRSQCPYNHFCSADGKCISMTQLPNYGKACKKEYSQLGNPYTRQPIVCGGLGLQCIQGKCIICGDSYERQGPIRDKSITNYQNRLWLPALCINGEYVRKDDLRAFWNVYTAESILFFIFLFVTLSRQVMASVYSKCFGGREGIWHLKKYFEEKYWDRIISRIYDQEEEDDDDTDCEE